MSSDEKSGTITFQVLRSAFKGVAWISLGRIISGIFGFLTTPIIIYFLKPSQYGIGTLVFSVVGIVSTFCEFGLGQSIIKTISDARATGRNWEVKRLIIIAVTTSLFVGLIVSFSLIRISSYLSEILNVPEASELLQMGAILIIVMPVHNIALSAISSLQEFRLLTALRLLGVFARLFSFIILFNLQAVGMIASLIVSYSTVSLVALLSLFKYFSSLKLSDKESEWEWTKTSQNLFGFSIYMFAADFVKLLHNKSDVLLLSLLGDMTIVGYYKAATELSSPFLGLIQSNNYSVLFPILSKYHASNDKEMFRRIHQTFMKIQLAITVPLAFGIIVLIRPTLSLFLPKYLPVTIYFQILAIQTPILASKNLYNPVAVLALRMPEKRLRLSLIFLVCHMTLMFLGIPRFGINGAVAANILIHVIALLMSYRAVKDGPVASLPGVYYYRLLGSSIVMSTFVYFLSRVFPLGVSSILIGVILGVVSFSLIFLKVGGVTSNEIRALDQIFGSILPIQVLLRIAEKIRG